MKWMDSSAPFTMMPDTNYCNIIVPTMDTVQMSYLLDMLLTNHKPVSAPPCPASPYTKAQVRVAGSCCALGPVRELCVHDPHSLRCCASDQQARERPSPSPTSS